MLNTEKKIKESQDYWNVKKAGNHLLFKLSPYKGKFKNFKTTEEDLNALKSLLGYINRAESGIINNNQIMAKLFIMHLTWEIRESKTTMFDRVLKSEISNQLSKPLALFYKTFHQDLCANQLNRLNDEDFKIYEFEDVIKNKQRFEETFTLEFVTGKLNEMMSNILHRRS